MTVAKAAIFSMLFAWSISSAATPNMNWNLSTSPMDWLTQANGRLDRQISKHWSLGISGFYMNRVVKTVQMKESSGGLYLSRSFSPAMTDGWFLDFGTFYGRLQAQAQGVSGQSGTLSVVNITERALLGYQWFFGLFNLSLSTGWEGNSAGGAAIKDSSGNTIATLPIFASHGILEFSVGLAF